MQGFRHPTRNEYIMCWFAQIMVTPGGSQWIIQLQKWPMLVGIVQGGMHPISVGELLVCTVWRGAKTSCEIVPTTILESPELSSGAGMFHVEEQIVYPFQKKKSETSVYLSFLSWSRKTVKATGHKTWSSITPFHQIHQIRASNPSLLISAWISLNWSMR